jgi:hypothetical protein
MTILHPMVSFVGTNTYTNNDKNLKSGPIFLQKAAALELRGLSNTG